MTAVPVTTRVQWRNEFGRFEAAIDTGAQRAEKQSGEIGAHIAAGLAPHAKGILAGSIHSTGHGFATGALPQALPQEEGASPHLIGAEFDAVLENPEEGFGPVIGPVLHPGNPAVHYMRDALKLVNSRLMGIIRANMP